MNMNYFRLYPSLPCAALMLILMLQAVGARADSEHPAFTDVPGAVPVAVKSAPVVEITELGDQLDEKLDGALERRSAARTGYVARNDGARDFFNALSVRLRKPVVVSQKAAQRKVSGDFDLNRPQQALERIALQLGLIWYHDGQSVYVYDASEARNLVITLSYITVNKLKAFLRQSGLYDHRFPFRGMGRGNVFYLSAPPVYVDLVASTARFLDSSSTERSLGNLKIGVVRLENTFVGDRSFTLRDQTSTVPGMATVIENILKDENIAFEMSTAPSARSADTLPPLSSLAPLTDLPPPLPVANAKPGKAAQPTVINAAGSVAASNGGENKIKVLAYPDTNSLLIKGTPEQVAFIENLIAILDVAKRHVELSLWIIDMQADQLDQLGVNWQGSVGFGSSASVSFNNTPVSTVDGFSFMAAIKALKTDEKARIVSRPVVLTQENTPAFFDHNRTFYVKLQGERAVQLEHVTFGTLIKVLPRFAADGQIEMSLDIEDGNEVSADSAQDSASVMPKVARTRISTIARVPKGKSLLVGGYTRDEGSDRLEKIPLLGDLPLVGGAFRKNVKRESNMVRLFLIEPKYNDAARQRDASELVDDVVADIKPEPVQEALRDYVDRKNGN
jgi:type II secretory pathway component GspD/PulD (secretin)